MHFKMYNYVLRKFLCSVPKSEATRFGAWSVNSLHVIIQNKSFVAYVRGGGGEYGFSLPEHWNRESESHSKQNCLSACFCVVLILRR